MPITDHIGKTGRIRSGQHAGFLVRIQDDTRSSGGYFVLYWHDDAPVSYDNWVSSLTELARLVEEDLGDVEWME